jgi:flagellum-specific ATP synthase
MNHYPPIDILRSISRIMKDIVPAEQVEYTTRIIEILSEYERAEDLINIGAYSQGSNKRVDYAISMIDKVRAFLRQKVDERATIEDAINSMKILFYV